MHEGLAGETLQFLGSDDALWPIVCLAARGGVKR